MAKKKPTETTSQPTENNTTAPLQPPPHLTGDALEAWRTIAKHAGDVLRNADGLLVEQAACWFARWRGLEAELATADPSDVYKLTILASTASKAFALISGKLGIGPADRAKLEKNSPPPRLPPRESPFERLAKMCARKAE